MLLASTFLGCERFDRGEQAPGDMLTSGEFVEVYVSLLEAEREAESQEDFEARRDAILQQHDATREELVRFVEAHTEDPEFLAAVWDSIDAKLQALGEERDSLEESPSPVERDTSPERRSGEEQLRLEKERALDEPIGRRQPLPREQ